MPETSHRIALILDLVDDKLRAGAARLGKTLATVEKGAEAASARLGHGVAQASEKAERAMHKMGDAAEMAIGKHVHGAAGRAEKGLESLRSRAEGVARVVAGSFEKTSKAATHSMDKMGHAAHGASGHMHALMMAMLAFSAGGVAAKFFSFASEFERRVADIATLTDGASVSVGQFREQLLQLATRSSRGLDDLSKGLYDILSSGIGAADAMRVLEAAEKGATAGGADLESVGKLVASVLNAYEGSGLSAARVIDELRVAVDRGVATMPELSSALGQVISVASSFGVSFEEVLAAITQMTLKGLSTAEAVTSVRQALISLARPPENVQERLAALNVEMGVAKLQSVGFIGALEELEKATGGSAQAFAEIFTDVDGLKGVLGLLSSGLSKTREQLDAVKNSAGANDKALAKVTAAFSEQYKVLKNRLSVALVQVGTRHLPALLRVLDAFAQSVESGGLQSALSAIASTVLALGQAVAKWGGTVLKFFVAFGAVKIGAALIAGLDSLRGKLAELGKAGGQATKFGQEYAASYFKGFAGGVGKAGWGTVIRKALLSPGNFALVAGAAAILGDLIGNALGKALAAGIEREGEEALANTKEMGRRKKGIAALAGAKSEEEFDQVREDVRTGRRLLRQSPAGGGAASQTGRPAFAVADTVDVSRVFVEEGERAQGIVDAKTQEMDAAIARAEAEIAALQARQDAATDRAGALETDRAASRGLEAGAKDFVAEMRGEGTAQQLNRTRREVDQLVDTLNAGRFNLNKAIAERAEFLAAVADAEREAAEQQAERLKSLDELTEKQKAAEATRLQKAAEATRLQKEAERAREEAKKALAELQATAAVTGDEAAIGFLDALVAEQERLVEASKAQGTARTAALTEAGAAEEEIALAEQANARELRKLLDDQIAYVQRLQDLRIAAAENAGQVEIEELRARAEEEAKHLSPEAREVQAAEVAKLVIAYEQQTAAAILEIRTNTAKQTADIEEALRAERRAAEIAFQKQLVEGTARAMQQIGFKEEEPEEKPEKKQFPLIRNLVGAVWDGLAEYGQAAVSKVAGLAGRVFADTWVESFSAKIGSIAEGAGSVAGALGDGAAAGVGALAAEGAARGSKAIEAAKQIPDRMEKAFLTLTAGLTDAFGAIGDNAGARLGELLTGFAHEVNDIFMAPLRQLLGEDLAQYLGPILKLPGALFERINAAVLQPALGALSAPADRLLGVAGDAFSALTDPENTDAALKKRLDESAAKTEERAKKLEAEGQFDKAAEVRAEGAAEQDTLRREHADRQPDAVIERVVEQANQMLGRVVQQLPALVGTVLDTLIRELPRFISQLSGAFAGVLESLASRLGPLLTTVIDSLLHALPKLIDGIVALIPSLLAALLDGIIMLVEKLPSILVTLLNAVIELLPKLFEAIAERLPALVVAIVDAVPKIIMAIVDALPQIISAVIEGIGTIVGELIAHLPEIIMAIMKAVPMIIWALIKLVPLVVYGLMAGMTKALPRVFEGVIEAFSKVGTAITKAATFLWGSITKAATFFWDAITGAAKSVGGFFGDAWDSTIGALFHEGGMVTGGRNPGLAGRLASLGVPRFAEGGLVGALRGPAGRALRGDEVPALLKLGEAVLTPRGVNAVGGPGGVAAANAGQVPGGTGGLVLRIEPAAGGLDALLRLLIGRVTVEAADRRTPLSRAVERGPIRGLRPLKTGRS